MGLFFNFGLDDDGNCNLNGSDVKNEESAPMTNRVAQFNEIYENIDSLIEINKSLVSRIESLEQSQKELQSIFHVDLYKFGKADMVDNKSDKVDKDA